MQLGKILCFILLSIAISACGNKTETTEATETEEHHEDASTVTLTDVQIKTAELALGKIEMKNLSTALSVNGTLEVPSQNKAWVTALVNGILRSIKVQPGDYVKKGQVIGTVANTELAGIQQQLVAINAQIRYAEQELSRQRTLVEGNAAPYKNVQKTEAELSGLRAQRSALQKQLAAIGAPSSGISSELNITAPISGTISEISAQIGSQVDANAPIAEIINNSELHLDLFVYERDLPNVKKGQNIHFTLTNNPGKEYDAEIYSVGTAFANETRAVPVHAHVINDKTGLIEGMSVTAKISLGAAVYPSVPDEAIISNGGNDYIFILSEKKADARGEAEELHEPETAHQDDHVEHSEAATKTFERVQVIRGASDVGYTEIKPVVTIAQEAKIVVKGAFFLMAKMTNAGEAHEH
jgi:membrane fusion protein, heavy metal efflux system